MQRQPEKKLDSLETNPWGNTLPLRQPVTNPRAGRNRTKPERFPDFFLIGAPRCGTTALSRYLADNPQVCFSTEKEPHYFSLLAPHAALDDLETVYLARYFSHYGDGHKAIGEGSTSYLYSLPALQRILWINAQAKFIVLVRNPLEMLPSYHLRLLFSVMEEVEDFATAWRLQEERARGERIPKLCLAPQLLLYREVGKFGAQVERLYRLAGRDQALVLLFDDLVRDPGAVYKQVLAFIGVEDDGRTRFQRKLGSKMYRYRWLQQLLYAPLGRNAPVVDTWYRRLNQKKASGRKSWLKRVARWNMIKVRPAPLAPAMRETLRATFAPDVAKLSTLLHRDLSHWLEIT
jgi:Sulfotransferase family